MRKAVQISLMLAVWAGAAGASSYVAVSDEALVDQAPVVVVGQVLSVDPGAGAAARTARTEFEIEVVEVLKGEAPGLVRVAVPGGQIGGGRALKIHGAPRLRPGERVLLFLVPRGETFLIHHLALGVFHQVEAGGRKLATRRMEGASEIRRAGAKAAPAFAAQALRDFDAFAAWVRARAAGEQSAADYRVAEQPGLRSAVDAFTLFEDVDSARNLRWFGFDTGGNVSWRAFNTGQTGLGGGGYSEFQTALLAWNAEAQTPVDYRYNSNTTGSTNGLDTYDSVNSIVFNDPTDILDPFSCVNGGFLALGGPWYDGNVTRQFKGLPFHEILNADIVINSGIACFFADSPNASKAAQELFGHELGHTLGIGHACGDDDGGPACTNPALDDALMRAFVHDDNRGARLGSDDIAALQFLYTAAPAAPSNLAAAAVSTTEIALTWTDNSNNETSFRIERKTLGGSYVEVASAPANSTGATVGGLSPETAYSFRVRARNGNGDSSYSNEAAAATKAVPGACVADAQTSCLGSGRFKVRVLWRAPGGVQTPANLAPAGSDDAGIFYFANPSNWELLLKVLNACGINSHYWVFYAATTNLELLITVTDTTTGAVKFYFNPLNTAAPPVQDTSAFATCP